MTKRHALALAVMLSLVLAFLLAVIPHTAHASTVGNQIAKAAASVSYSQATYKGEGTGTKAYLKACKTLLGSYYAKNEKQMQCNVPVAVAVRLSGADDDFPTTNAKMYRFLKESSDWKCLGNYNGKTSSLKPGDILIRIGGTTTYTDKKTGKKVKAATNHACVYVGKKIATSIYKSTLKGTDADKGTPGKNRVFVSAHVSKKNAAKRSAACLETANQAYADYRMLVFRYVGSSSTAQDDATTSSASTASASESAEEAEAVKVDATAAAKAIAKAGASVSYSRIVYKAKGTGTKAYLKACKTLLGSYYAKNQKQMQSNVPVALAVRMSGVDGSFPTTMKAMYSYMKKSSSWKCLGNYNGKTSSLKPGDILISVKGTTTYTNAKGKKAKASSNRACLYVGKSIASSVYKSTLKGTDADKGTPGKSRVFVHASASNSNTAKRTAACLETAKQAGADTKMLVFRYVG